MSDSKTVSVVGCGWLGLPLAIYLLQQNYVVRGSKTSLSDVQKLRDLGIDGFQLSLSPTLESNNISELLNASTLIVNIPPKRRENVEQFHWDQMLALKAAVHESPIQQVIFVSSTSVYPNTNNEVAESCKLPADKASGRVLQRIEALWLNDPTLKTTVVRFAGLIGDDRLPGRFLAGKRNLKNGNTPVNLIHRDDCIGIITAIIEQNAWGHVFNACSDQHPMRKELYTKAADNLGLDAPQFEENDVESFKIVNSDLLKTTLNYTFLHPDPMALV